MAERIVAHLGLGAFHRAHQAWYTQHAADAGGWSLVGFTGRSPEQARILARRRGAYTLLVRGPEVDAIEQITAIRRAHDGADRAAWEGALADAAVTVLTLTITEAGYRLDPRAPGGDAGRLDLADPAVRQDLRAPGTHGAVTAPVRIALGLDARRRAGAGPLEVISCDNLVGNGRLAGAVVLDAARAWEEADPAAAGLASWIEENVHFRSSMVDRITPRTVADDLATAERLSGVRDEAVVVCEPFSEWLLEPGALPAPDWASAGARIVDDLVPYEERKLRLLNGAHSLLAHHGLLHGLTDVAEAFADPRLRDLVEEYWETAAASCRLPDAELAAAIAATRKRFANPRIRHRLAQIAEGARHKLPQRILPVLRSAIASGHATDATASVVAAWILGEERAGRGVDPDVLSTGDAALDERVRTLVDRALRRLDASVVV